MGAKRKEVPEMLSKDRKLDDWMFDIAVYMKLLVKLVNSHEQLNIVKDFMNSKEYEELESKQFKDVNSSYTFIADLIKAKQKNMGSD